MSYLVFSDFLCFKISIKKLIINRIEYKINSIIKFALPMWGVGIMNFVFLWIDKLIILSTLTLENLGVYQISIMMWGFIILFPQSVSVLHSSQLFSEEFFEQYPF